MPATEQILEFPGFLDVHVHFRDPGVPTAETTASGLAAAARGGFGAVVTMPNTTPALDTPEMVVSHTSLRRDRSVASPLEAVGDSFSRDRSVASPLGASATGARHSCLAGTEDVILFTSACITKGRLGREVADLEALAAAGAAFFTDDGTYVSDAKVMEEAMHRAYELNFVVSQHALAPGVSEADAIRRDLSLCRETGCRLHVQHISTAAGIALVRDAQKEGLPVTAEATPHHILLCQDDIIPAIGGNFKMAPPLATAEDRAEVRRAVKDGVLMFATDHAPHPAATKNVPYEQAANGIIGLETAIPITYHVMVEEEGMSVEKWAEAWWKMPLDILPAELAKTPLRKTRVAIGAPKKVDVASFASLSRNCPYDGMEFTCWSVL